MKIRKYFMKKHLIILGAIIFSTILFQYCCSNQINQKNMSETELSKRKIQPFPRGLIEASITPIEVGERSDKYFCKAAIKKVHKTGGGIRPIAENIEYNFAISDDFFEQLNNKIGKTIICRIAEDNNLLKNNMNEYKIISIIKK